MKTRIITAVVAFAIFVPFLIFSDTMLFSVAIMAIATVGVYEMFHCCGLHKALPLILPYYLVALTLPYVICLYANTYPQIPLVEILLLTVIFLLIWTYPCAIFSKGKISVTDASTAAMGSIYLIAGANSIIYVRQAVEAGGYLFVLIFIGAWVTDSAAYFCGRALGKHKLIPDVSPKKTVEGSIGGILFCVLFFFLFGMCAELWIGADEIETNYLPLLISAFFISIVSQIGDLAMSLLKRHYGIKDFGRIFPGHGGILDRFDSVFAVAMVLVICCAFSEAVFGIKLFEVLPATL